MHARARRTSRKEASDRASDLLAIVDGVLTADEPIRRRAFALYPKGERLSVNDVLIAATAIENNMALVSADLDFTGVKGLQLIAPDSARARALIA